MDTYAAKLTFTQPILGTVPKDPEIYTQHVQAKALEAAKRNDLNIEAADVQDEIETVEKIEEKGWTGFHHALVHHLPLNEEQINEQPILQPVLYDYVIKGFFKDACGMLRRAKGTRSSKITAYRKIIDGLVFIGPRQIPLNLNGLEMGTLERPLRAQTAQGERVALARSDTCPPGTTLEFEITVLGQITEAILVEWLDYGRLRGLGQWRNASWGVFEHTITRI